MTWRSPLREDDFREYRDAEALRKAGISALPRRALKEFWPARGPVWAALGVGSDGRALFVETKAHITDHGVHEAFLDVRLLKNAA